MTRKTRIDPPIFCHDENVERWWPFDSDGIKKIATDNGIQVRKSKRDRKYEIYCDAESFLMITQQDRGY